jgi:hypothetical protein
MLERKQALSVLLLLASASVGYQETSEGILREKSLSSPGFPPPTGRLAPPTLVRCSSSGRLPEVDMPAAFVWLPLVIGSGVCRRGDTNL